MNKLVRFFLIVFISLACSIQTFSQDVNIQTNSFILNQIERLEIKSGNLSNPIFFDLKPFTRTELSQFLDTLKSDSSFSKRLSKADNWWMNYFQNEFAENKDSADNFKLKKIRPFYQYNNAFLSVNKKDFKLFLNPVFYFEQGNSKDSGHIFRNTKGLELRGSIFNKVSFYTYLTDNQTNYPAYVAEFVKNTGTLPGEGFLKSAGKVDYDYINAKGYISFNVIKPIRIQFGNEKLFFGDGDRSLLFSDFAKDFIHLKITTKIWKFNYQNVFAQFTDIQNLAGIGRIYPPKYGAFHFLSMDILKNWNLGLFEGVMFGKVAGRPAGFELSYLNPIIFYRNVEQQLGSTDNALLGANTSIILFKSVKLYGQILLDEFRISELKKQKGWAGNKYALQGGLKYINVAEIKNLDFQLEYNLVRPYVYASDTSIESFSNWKLPLGHPRGGNLKEIIAIIQFNPIGWWMNKIRISSFEQGISTPTLNAGNNQELDYSKVFSTHPYNNTLLQGDFLKVVSFEYRASFMLQHNLILDGYFIYRKQDSKSPLYKTSTDQIFSLGLKYNFISQNYSF